jgi:hypothetical protein
MLRGGYVMQGTRCTWWACACWGRCVGACFTNYVVKPLSPYFAFFFRFSMHPNIFFFQSGLISNPILHDHMINTYIKSHVHSSAHPSSFRAIFLFLSTCLVVVGRFGIFGGYFPQFSTIRQVKKHGNWLLLSPHHLMSCFLVCVFVRLF